MDATETASSPGGYNSNNSSMSSPRRHVDRAPSKTGTLIRRGKSFVTSGGDEPATSPKSSTTLSLADDNLNANSGERRAVGTVGGGGGGGEDKDGEKQKDEEGGVGSHLFLFNDLLLYATVVDLRRRDRLMGTAKYKYQGFFVLKGMEVFM